MELSILLAKVFGLYLLIAGVSLLINHKKLRRVFTDFTDHYSAVFTNGLFILLLGLLIVLTHNIWEGEPWVIAITVIGWLILLKGLLITLLPIDNMKKVVRSVNNESFYLTSAIVSIVLGIYLAYAGFTMVI